MSDPRQTAGRDLPRVTTWLVALFLSLAAAATASAATQTVARAVAAGSDDAEEKASGTMSLTSSDLELTYDGSTQTVGVRFTNLPMPQNAIIERAYIQFNVDELGSTATSLTIRGELPASGSAATFTSTARNISSRISAASPTVSWSPPAWNIVHLAGPDQATPDLSAIVQAIVDLPNWQSGNAAAFIITGTGKRTAEAYEGSPAYAPILRVEYREPGDVTLGSWRELGLKFNGLEVGVDTVSQRLFVPVGAGFGAPANYTPTITYSLGDLGYSLGFGGQPEIASGSTHDFGDVAYGSESTVQLYYEGQILETYTLVLTNTPVISLAADNIVDEPKLPGTFALASGQFNQNLATGPMGIEFRGETSQQYEKKSFSIELQETDPLIEREIKLLDMRKDGDWITDATYRDTTYVRNIVSMDIYRAMRPFAHYTDGTGKGQPSIRGYVSEVILNERYHGVYILEEKVDRKLLGVAKVNVPLDTNGVEQWDQVDWNAPANQSAIYKADKNNATMGTTYTLGGDWEQEYPDPDDEAIRWEPLVDLINFVNYSTDAEFIAEVGNLVDIDSVVDFWLLTNMTTNRDSLKKNYFIARSSNASGAGKWFFVPWDNDATFGMKWDGDPYPSASWWDPNKNKLIGRLTALTATGFNAKVKLRWNALRGTLFTTDALTNRFIAYQQVVEPNANGENARSRNLERWPGSGGMGNDNPELATIAYIRDFIQRRIAYLDTKIASLPQ